MIKNAHGTVHGRTIEVDEDLGIAAGQEVEIQIRVIEPASVPDARWGEGLQRCAGALADEWTEDDDRILDEIRQERKRDTRPDILP